MNILFNSPYSFRGKRYRTLQEIANTFLPPGMDSRSYCKSVMAQLRNKRPKTESEFIESVKPFGNNWFFFDNTFFSNEVEFIEKHKLPGRLSPYVLDLISDDLLDTEKSLTMLLQEFRRGVLLHKMKLQESARRSKVFGKSFDDVASIKKLIPFIKFSNLEHAVDTEAYVLDALNRYYKEHPVRLGIVHIDSFSMFQSYTQLGHWELLHRIKNSRKFINVQSDIFPTVAASDSPVVVNGELYKQLDDALRSYAIDWSQAMAKLLTENVNPQKVKDIFNDKNLVGSSRKDLVHFEGEIMPLVELMNYIGGRSSIFISRMREIEDDFNSLTIQRMIERHLLQSEESKLVK